MPLAHLDLRVYAITPDRGGVAELVQAARAALAGGVTCLQLRSKHLSARQQLELGLELRRLTRQHGVTFLVNDRPDLALAVGADGVHIGQDDLPLPTVRRLLGAGAVIGVSAETVDEALAAERAGADYLGVGPVYATASKEDAGAPYGPAVIARLAGATRLPIVGIGGITADNAQPVVAAGAQGVAVIAAIFGAPDPGAAAARLRRTVDAALAATPAEPRHADGPAASARGTGAARAAFSLHFVADRSRLGSHWRAVLERLASAGAGAGPDWLHARDPGAAAGDFSAYVQIVAGCARRLGAGLIVNDRCDIALACGAQGVQLPERGLPVAAAVRALGRRGLIGRSVHDREGALRAVEAGADYLLFGHVFATASKGDRPPAGPEPLARIVEEVPVPVIAIGGIDAHNLESVLATGCSGIAVVGAIAGAPDPAAAAHELRERLASSPARPRRPFPPAPVHPPLDAYE
ncbi:MAG TPA: thiamine phosphate synthase [Bacillota bacterium]